MIVPTGMFHVPHPINFMVTSLVHTNLCFLKGYSLSKFYCIYLQWNYNFDQYTKVSVWNNKRMSYSSPNVVYTFSMSYPTRYIMIRTSTY